MPRKRLTDATLKALEKKPAAAGKRYTIWDADVPNFGVRITDKGIVSYIVQKRLPGTGRMVRHTLGQYHQKAFPLAEAREQAYEVLRTLRQGRDPNALKRQQRQEQARAQALTFAAVAEEYIKLRLRGMRKGGDAATYLRNHLIPRWGALPIGDITEADISAYLAPIEAAGQVVSRNRRLSRIKALFNWAKEPGRRYVAANPAAEIRNLDEQPRQRTLSDDEIREVWAASKEAGFPVGPFVRLLLILGQRRTEIAGLRRSEIHDGVWVLPPERSKNGLPHAVPLPPMALAEIEALPNTGDVLFPGATGDPMSAYSRLKDNFDKLCPVGGWTFHDLRRSARSNWSKLRIDGAVAEALLNHTPEKLRRTYDTYDRLDEKREAMNRWSEALERIVGGRPATGNIIHLQSA